MGGPLLVDIQPYGCFISTGERIDFDVVCICTSHNPSVICKNVSFS